MHTCPVEGCTAQLPHDKLMCWWHWQFVPPPLQKDVYRTWNGGSTTGDYIRTARQAVECANEAVRDGRAGPQSGGKGERRG